MFKYKKMINYSKNKNSLSIDIKIVDTTKIIIDFLMTSVTKILRPS